MANMVGETITKGETELTTNRYQCNNKHFEAIRQPSIFFITPIITVQNTGSSDDVTIFLEKRNRPTDFSGAGTTIERLRNGDLDEFNVFVAA